MSYAPCHFCGTVTSIHLREPICGTCEIMLNNVDQRQEDQPLNSNRIVDSEQLEENTRTIRSLNAQRPIRVSMSIDGNLILEDDASQFKGATESDIAILKKRTSDINDSERNIECAICTEKFEYLELTQLPCNHEYHSECIQHWLKLNASCPICRQSISSTQQGEQEPNIIIIRRDTTNLTSHNNNTHFLDDVD